MSIDQLNDHSPLPVHDVDSMPERSGDGWRVACSCGFQKAGLDPGDAYGTASKHRHLNALPPVECKPWCTIGDGHPKEHAPEDQACISEQVRIELPLDDHLTVYAVQGPVEPLRLSIARASEPDSYYSPAEAKQLADAVTTVLGKVAR